MSYGIFMLISLLLHLMTILALIVLYQRYALLKAELGPFTEDLQDKLEKFVKRIEEENEAFYQLLVDYIKEKETTGKGEEKGKVDFPTTENESPSSFLDYEESEEGIYKIEEEKLKQDEPPLDPKAADPFLQQVISLYQQGYSPQEIGRQLNKGVGEIQLMLNLYHHQD